MWAGCPHPAESLCGVRAPRGIALRGEGTPPTEGTPVSPSLGFLSVSAPLREIKPRSRVVGLPPLPKASAPPVPFREFTKLSPNRDLAPPHEQLGVVFHHSVLSFDEAIALMLNPASKVSYHVIIGLDGTRCTLVPEAQVAWHAGVSSFRGRLRCNDFLLGVYFAGNTNEAPLD